MPSGSDCTAIFVPFPAAEASCGDSAVTGSATTTTRLTPASLMAAGRVAEHRRAAQFMQGFGNAGLHPGALAGGQDDTRAGVHHSADPTSSGRGSAAVKAESGSDNAGRQRGPNRRWDTCGFMDFEQVRMTFCARS